MILLLILLDNDPSVFSFTEINPHFNRLPMIKQSASRERDQGRKYSHGQKNVRKTTESYVYATASFFNNADEGSTDINGVSPEFKGASEASNQANSIIPESCPFLNNALDTASQI